MADQGAGGGIESHLTHTRKQSESEQIPDDETSAEATPEPVAKDEFPDDQFSQPGIPQILLGLPRDGSNTPGTPSRETRHVTLSRQPSSSSTTSNSQTSELNNYSLSESQPRQPLLPRTSSYSLEPPVTKATLSELDVAKIIHNPKLRHDINFDPDLHFRPNLDGEKGRKKQEKANLFWSTLTAQLTEFVMERETFLARYGNDEVWSLPLLLRSVKEIIQTLVPQRDRDLLNEGLNVELLMQQFNRGVANLEKLASWLSGVLKLHCAPMRDEWVDEMYHELSNGNRNNDMGELVKGMRTLLSVLEAMKLDVANHQIRCLRPVLIEDTVNFEQRFFCKKIQARRLDIGPSRQWYRDAMRAEVAHAAAFGETAAFFNAVSKLVLPSTPVDSVPTTFLFDEDRIVKLRSDMFDTICLEICMRRYEMLERLARFSQLYPSVSAEETSEYNFSAPFTSSRPSSLVFSEPGSDTSSPRNSGLFVVPVPEFVETRPRALDLYNSLVALIHTAPPAGTPIQRWQGLGQPMAIQILRYVDLSNSSFSPADFEDELVTSLTDVHGNIFREVEVSFHERLLAELARRVKEFKALSGVGLFSIATGGRINPPGRTWHAGRDRDHRDPARPTSSPGDPRDEAGIEDMAVRLSHLGILHWRVWSQMAYLTEPNFELVAAGSNSVSRAS